MVPTPAGARNHPNSPCTPIDQRERLNLCAFGVPPSGAGETVALLGDSHAAHWRAALEVVTQAKGWRGVSITRSGCPYSKATRALRRSLRVQCTRRNRDVPDWFARHPEVKTVFVSGLSGAKWRMPRAQDQFEAEVAEYIRAWNELPPSVEHIVVIRDNPKVGPGTHACVERAVAKRRPPGATCAVPRRLAIDRDAAVVAAARLGSSRVQTVDLTGSFCSHRSCFPVIGGALVQKDQHHLVAVFVETLGPYLLRQVERLSQRWGHAPT